MCVEWPVGLVRSTPAKVHAPLRSSLVRERLFICCESVWPAAWWLKGASCKMNSSTTLLAPTISAPLWFDTLMVYNFEQMPSWYTANTVAGRPHQCDAFRAVHNSEPPAQTGCDPRVLVLCYSPGTLPQCHSAGSVLVKCCSAGKVLQCWHSASEVLQQCQLERVLLCRPQPILNTWNLKSTTLEVHDHGGFMCSCSGSICGCMCDLPARAWRRLTVL